MFRQSPTLVSKATAFSLIFTFLLFVLSTTPVYAQDPPKIVDIVDVLKRIISLLAPAAGIAFLIMLIIGGFQFINSGGDPKAAGQARTTLTYAIVGILLVVASWLILTVIAAVTGVNVTRVEIPSP